MDPITKPFFQLDIPVVFICDIKNTCFFLALAPEVGETNQLFARELANFSEDHPI